MQQNDYRRCTVKTLLVFSPVSKKEGLSGGMGFPSVCLGLDKGGCLMQSIDLTDHWKEILAPNWKALVSLHGLLANPLSKKGT